MTFERKNARPAPKYQGKKKQRWPTRIALALVSVAGMLGLWQFVAHEPAASAHPAPNIQDAEQQLQLGNSNDGSNIFSIQNAPNPPNVISGMS
jgi:heme A synthase